MKNEKLPLGLYLHIPFCASKCKYCDFYSFRTNDEDMKDSYISAMMLQMEDISENCRDHEVDTVYIGGGTPSLLSAKQIARLLDSVKHNFRVDKNAEITIEANPGTIDEKKLRAIKKLGVNRLSIGLQSAHDSELKVLGRIHTMRDFDDAFRAAREAGFDNISVDVMYGIPNQTQASFVKTLEYVTGLSPEHISLYCLKVEEGTPFYKMREEGRLALPDDDEQYEMYSGAVDYLAARGYERYEMSNFAKDGRVSKHNMKYWNCEEYIGIGAAAHSYFGGERYSMIRNATNYIDGLEILEAGIKIVDESRFIEKNESMNEYVMLRMRLEDGVDPAVFGRLFGVDFVEKFGRYLNEYVKDGFVTKKNGHYAFTTKGMFVSNYILSAVLDFPADLLSDI